ncbi:MAG: CdaR family protein [Lachnospiraceae bacterium]|nr:CdaR family protein [Lachnospiraceae bacterium]
MKKSLTHNIGLKVMSIFVAFLLWIVVVSIDDPITTKSFGPIDVELVNTNVLTAAGKVYEVEEGTDSVSIIVTAKRSILYKLSKDNFTATADLKKLDGTMVPIEVKASRFADKIEDINLKTKNVLVGTEKLLEQQYTIEATTSGTLAEGCVIGEVGTDKNVVKVSGPESVVATISKAVVNVNVSGMTSDISTSESIVLYDEKGNVIDTKELTLSRDVVNVNVEIWNSKTVPVIFGYVGAPANGFATTGEITNSITSVAIAGKKANLNKVSNITIPSSAVDITGEKKNAEIKVDLSKYLPSGVVFADSKFDSTTVVTVGIQELQTKNVEVPITSISVNGVPEGMTATIGGVGEQVVVEIRGLGDSFTNIDPSTIKGTVNLDSLKSEDATSNLTVGVYECKVEFTYPDGIYNGNNEIIVKIILKDKGEE